MCGLSSTGKTVFLVDHGADNRVEQDGLTRDLHWHSQSSRSCHAIVCLKNLDDLASTGNGHHTLIGKQAQVNMIGSTTQSRSIMSRSLFGCSRHHEHTVTHGQVTANRFWGSRSIMKCNAGVFCR